jgi:hypothetical protein
MSATVEILGIHATVDGGKWTCSDADVLGLLEARAEAIGDSPSIPDIDEELALDAMQFGADIVKHSDRPKPRYPKGTVH